MKRKIIGALMLALCLAGCGDTVVFLPNEPVELVAVPVGGTEGPTIAAVETETQVPTPAVPEETETAKIQSGGKAPSSANKGNTGTGGKGGSTTVTKPAETKPTATEPKETKPEPTESAVLRPTEPPATKPGETEPEPTEAVTLRPTEPPATEPPATEPPATEIPVTEPPSTEPPETEPPLYDISGYVVGNLEYEILDRINEYRTEEGLEALYLDGYLCAIASCRGYEASLVWSHTRPDGRSFATVLDDYGYGAGTAQELLAYATGDAGAMVDKWMSSDSHRDILLGGYTTLGVGVYRANGVTFVACLVIG